MKIFKKLKKAENAFYAGPEWFHFAPLEKANYKSPALALTAWFYGWVARLLTVPGRFIFFTTIVILPYSTIMLDSPVRTMALALLTAFAADFFTGWLLRPRLKIDRHIPNRARAGTEIRVLYKVTNLRKKTVWDLNFDPYNLKKGLVWQKHAQAAGLDGNETTRISGTLFADRRGKYRIYQPIADSSFPLGIFKWSCRCRTEEPTELLIHPSYHELNSLILPGGRKFQREGNTIISKIGESMDFFGCREFRNGDDPRHIDWPGSARQGKLIVMEYQEEQLARAALITDTFNPRKSSFFQPVGGHRTTKELEASLSLSAALSDFLIRSDFIIDVFIAGSEVYHFKAGRSLAGVNYVLDILACVEPGQKSPGDALTPSVLEEITGLGCAILVFLKWDEERKKLVDTFRKHGIGIKLYLLTGKPSPDMPDDAIILNPDDILEGKVLNL